MAGLDLDTMTVPDVHDPGHEVFDPVNAWPDASQRIVVATYRVSPRKLGQLGFDPTTDEVWMRVYNEAAGTWGAWVHSSIPVPES